METTSKSCWWSIVINNPTENDRIALLNPPDWVKNLSGQDEVAPTTGTLHIQACLNTQSVRFSAIKNWLVRANIQACYKSAKALENYCKKSKTAVEGSFFEFHRDERNVITEPEPERMEPLLNALITIANHDSFSDEFEDAYNFTVSNLILEKPTLVDQLTATRVKPTYAQFRLQFKYLAEEAARMLSWDFPDEDSRQGTECLINDPPEDDIRNYNCPHCNKDGCQLDDTSEHWDFWACQKSLPEV